jgi:hypothetical protein
MDEGLQVSARFVASILARIYGPSIYDTPRFGGGGPLWSQLVEHVAGPHPDPWRAIMLNPQPLPPRARYALGLTDAYMQEIVQLDRVAILSEDAVAQRAVDRSFRLVADVDELCPRWPRWPKTWPPPPPPPWWRETMTDTELFLFGTRILAAAEALEHGQLQEAVARLGERVLDLSARGG